jgi:hypothetical protein
MKGQKIEDVKTSLMKSTVLAMSTAIAISLAISVIYFVILLQTQSAEIPDSFKLASLLGSSVLVIWTTSTFWAEVKKLAFNRTEDISAPSKKGDGQDIQLNLPMTLQVVLPMEGWGSPKSPVQVVVTGGTLVGELVSKVDGKYHLPPERIWYVDTGSQVIGPEHYRGTLEAVGIKNGQTIALTDRPLGGLAKPKSISMDEVEEIVLTWLKKEKPQTDVIEFDTAELKENQWHISGHWLERAGPRATTMIFEATVDAQTGKIVKKDFRDHTTIVG